MKDLKTLLVFFYPNNNRREPVRDWLKSLRPEDRRLIGEDIKDVEFSWPIGMPLVRAMGNGLWEVEHQMVLLHGFIKKTQKTAEQELKLALGRMREGKT